MVTLGNVRPQGKQLSLEMVKSSMLNEQTDRKNKESISDPKDEVTEGDSNRGRGGQRSSQNRDRSRTRLK